MSDASEAKTESPTPRKLREARDEGRIASSRELVQAGALLAGLLLFEAKGDATIGSLVRTTRSILDEGLAGGADPKLLIELSREGLAATLLALVPIGLLLWATALLLGVLQSAFLFRPANILPRWSRVSPSAGLARLLSARAIARALFVGFEIAVVACAFAGLWDAGVRAADDLVRTSEPGEPGRALGTLLLGSALSTAVSAASGLVTLAAGDWALRRFLLLRELRMTRDEVLAEQRDDEIDPEILHRRRSFWRSLATRRGLGASEGDIA